MVGPIVGTEVPCWLRRIFVTVRANFKAYSVVGMRFESSFLKSQQAGPVMSPVAWMLRRINPAGTEP